MQVQVQHAANLVATYRASHSFWALDRVSKLKQLIPAQTWILSAKRVVLIYLQQAWQIPWCGCDHILNDEGTLPNAQMLATLLLTDIHDRLSEGYVYLAGGNSKDFGRHCVGVWFELRLYYVCVSLRYECSV